MHETDPTEDKIDESLDESFPASDSPAVTLLDEPPVNAQALWDAADARQRDEARKASSDNAIASQ